MPECVEKQMSFHTLPKWHQQTRRIIIIIIISASVRHNVNWILNQNVSIRIF